MTGIDTNGLVRSITQDDPLQWALATTLFEKDFSSESQGFVTLVSLCELVWVLEECYDTGKKEVGDILKNVLTSRSLRVEREDLAWKAVRRYGKEGADFSDFLIAEISREAGCKSVVTFDKKAAKSQAMVLLSGHPPVPSLDSAGQEVVDS